MARSVAELVRKAVRSYVEKLGSSKLITFREISLREAGREVTAYLRRKPGVVWPDEMAEELGIDYRLVLQVVNGLTRAGKVQVLEKKRRVIAK